MSLAFNSDIRALNNLLACYLAYDNSTYPEWSRPIAEFKASKARGSSVRVAVLTADKTSLQARSLNYFIDKVSLENRLSVSLSRYPSNWAFIFLKTMLTFSYIS